MNIATSFLLSAAMLAAAAFTAQGAGPAPATRPSTAPTTHPAALASTIDKAIKLLEAEKHEEVMRLLIEPKQLEGWLENTPMDRLVKGFAGRKAGDLLLVLKQARAGAPVLSSDGKRATFKLDGAVRKDVDFARIGESWYLEGP